MTEELTKDLEKYIKENYKGKDYMLDCLDRLYYTTQIPKTPFARKNAYEELKKFIEEHSTSNQGRMIKELVLFNAEGCELDRQETTEENTKEEIIHNWIIYEGDQIKCIERWTEE